MKTDTMKNNKSRNYRTRDFLKLFQISFFTISLLLVIFVLVLEADAQTGDITHVHDPCIIKCDDYYYIFSTGDRLAVRRSKDLIDWEFIGSVFNAIPSWSKIEVPGVTNIWAPDIFYHDGTYYLYYSLSTFGSNRSCIGFATNVTLDPEDLNYKWVDQGKVFQSEPGKDNFNAIDPNIVMDDSGKIWMSFGSFWGGIKMVELDSTTWKAKSDGLLYSIASRSGVNAIEAPFIIYKNGYYYLFVSFDFCCKGVESDYKIMVGRSDRIIGPYIDRYGKSMMDGGGNLLLSGYGRWRGPGHCAVLLERELSWLIHHAYDAEKNGIATLQVRPLGWDKDGWTLAGELIQEIQEVPTTVPTGYALYQNFPNPFKSTTTIKYDLPELTNVSLSIYDIRGNLVEILVNEQKMNFSYYKMWDAGAFSSGVYFCRMIAGDYTATKKLIIVR